MIQNVCICGKTQKTKPIVIIVTTCKNKHVCKQSIDLGVPSENIETKTESKTTSHVRSTNNVETIKVDESFSDINVDHIFYDTSSKEVIHEELKHTKDISINAPSTTSLQLPVILPRYHGPGCALEICVLEKHKVNCNWKKSKNENRNPVDDRIGSYDVIGRIKYRTCALSAKENKTVKSEIHTEVTDVHHLPQNDPMVMFSFPERNNTYSWSVVGYTKNQKILSIPSECGNKIDVSTGVNDQNKIEICYGGENKRCGKKSAVEELYFYGKSCNRCVQMDKIAKRKWYHRLVPCVFD
ncbi:uncharacterized protein LOC130903892 [Diorhabda carinulata]|uniref:uncharacterized protein LOC130903892 n=1 Tax=Diorhabda carinulata TaxID=1163345 RepID=UPI0025A07ECD|nr:uncharacterized protein LOC130903892 [Diorhabda carinulata]